MSPHHRRATASIPFAFAFALIALAPSAQGTDAAASTDEADAFGSRVGTESIGLYSESLVRGFDLQQAGNYLIDEAYFVRAGSPPDTIVEGSRIRVGPNALSVPFPAPSGIVQYRLLPADRDRTRIELGFQHLLDTDPRPFLRAHFARRSTDGAFSLAGGALGSRSARYIFGNEARYHGLGLVPRVELGDRWQATGFYGYYDQRYQADVGFAPAHGRMPRPDRLAYLGQDWSRYHTRNTTYGAILATRPEPMGWDFALSLVHSRVDRPRSDFNLFSNVTADGLADASITVARDRDVHSRAFEARAVRQWSGPAHRDRLTLTARDRRSVYARPLVDRIELGPVNLFDPPPVSTEPRLDPRPQANAGVDQAEAGIAWQRQWRRGQAFNVSVRNVGLDESARSVAGIESRQDSRSWLYSASVVMPVSPQATAFASMVRGIEEAGVAPQNASNAFDVLPPTLARQAELGVKWQHAGTALIGTAFEIAKPEPGFDSEGRFRPLTRARHRGVELSATHEATPGLRLLLGASWMRARLEGELVDGGSLGERPVGRPERLVLASIDYRPSRHRAWSFDADATYTGERPADPAGLTYTPGYTVINAGLRYRFALGSTPATVRLRVYNAADTYAWYADGSGLQAYEPTRRVMLSVSLGE